MVHSLHDSLCHAVGLMSGTSLDGVDAVWIETDGESRVELLGQAYVPFAREFQDRLQAIATGDVPLNDVLRAERQLMEHYAEAVTALGADMANIMVIGAHGQTIRHLPQEGLTWQLGDVSYLAERTGVATVMDFRRRDMAAGGQGAPFAPLYHEALLSRQGEVANVGVLNIGGVANLTWFDAQGRLRASDTGPGVGLLNALVRARTGAAYDQDGMLAAKGRVHEDLVQTALTTTAYWQRPWPRSADRYDFDGILSQMVGLSVEDACATLCAVTAASVAETLRHLSNESQGRVFVVGGGARNPTLMAMLNTYGVPAVPGEQIGLRGQTLEAECFAWLAVRHLRGLPTSEPANTGAGRATCGGVMAPAGLVIDRNSHGVAG